MSELYAAVGILIIAGLIFTYVIGRGFLMLADVINKGLDELLSELRRRK